MIDFIKNNRVIAGIALVILLLLGIVGMVALSLWNNSQQDTEKPDVSFGDTSQERILSEEEMLFGTSSEAWVASEGTGAPAPNFRSLTSMPVIGAVAFKQGDMAEQVRFTARTNGNVFEVPLTTVGPEVKVGNETIIRIGLSGWSKNAETTFTQYLDKTGEKIETYLRSFTGNTSGTQENSSSTTKGRHLGEDIVSSSLSPSGEKIFYIQKSEAGSVGYIENVATGAKQQVWTSLLTNLSSSWEAPDMILVYPNPTSKAEGTLWWIKPSTGKMQILLKGGLALAAKSNSDGTKILFSKQEEAGTFKLQILTLSTGEIKQLSLAAPVEKCAWSPQGSRYVYCAIPRKVVGADFLEKWYMGLEASDDQLWRLDTEVGITKMLFDPMEEVKEPFDIIGVMPSPSENFLIFRTKVKSGLWAYRLIEPVATSSPNQATSTPAQ